MVAQLLTKTPAVDAAPVKIADHFKAAGSISIQDCSPYTVNTSAIHHPEHIQNFFICEAIRTEREQLLQQALSISHTPVSFTCDGIQYIVGNLCLLLVGYVFQVFYNFSGSNTAKVEPLTATQNSTQYFLRFRGGKNEKNMVGRFLQGFEQRVEGFRRQHMNFVNDVNFAAAFGWAVPHGFAQFPYTVYPSVGGSVDFEHVDRISLRDFPAVGAAITRRRIASSFAVDGFCKDTGDRSFPHPARSGE